MLTIRKSGKTTLFTSILLILSLFAVNQFDIEPSLFLFNLLTISICGHFINHIVNPQYRNITFLLLTPIAIGYIFNPTILLYSMLAISVIYTILIININNLIKYIFFILLLSVLGIYIMFGKLTENITITYSILGTLLTYRIIIYIYENQSEQHKLSVIDKTNYFFMLPTVSMYLFPPVDYKTFTSSFNNIENQQIYNKGAIWISQGIFQLIIYRTIYHYIHIPLNNVNTLPEFAIHAITSYMFVIRLSGLFHIGSGILCLYGYNMPRTFDNYFLASDFSDLWRRLNTYFKDMMVKVFYYPIFFKLKHIGTIKAILITILIVYNASWFIHSLQWLWLKGTFPIKAGDLIYWNTFGVLVGLTTLKDLKKISITKHLNLSDNNRQLVKITFTFTIMCLLWSLWSAPTVTSWYTAMISSNKSFTDIMVLLIIISGFVMILKTTLYIMQSKKLNSILFPELYTNNSNILGIAKLTILFAVYFIITNNNNQHSFINKFENIIYDKLSEDDEEKQIEGYYTDLLLGTNVLDPIQTGVNKSNAKFIDTEGAIKIYEYRQLIMKPETSFKFKNKDFTINKLGGRDREYAITPPENTVRIITTGGSFVAGSGVSNEEVFDNIIEDSLNTLKNGINYEIINFGIPSYDLIDVLFQLQEDNLLKLKPKYLIYITHGKDLFKNANDLAYAFIQNIPINDDFLNNIINTSKLNKTMTENEIKTKLKLYENDITAYGYNKISQICKANQIIPIVVYWPTYKSNSNIVAHKNQVLSIAQNNGFIPIDLEQIYEGYTRDEITVSNTDIHPNAKAHNIFAQHLLKEIINLIVEQ